MNKELKLSVFDIPQNILDKINLIGDDKGGLYLFDRDIEQLNITTAAAPTAQ